MLFGTTSKKQMTIFHHRPLYHWPLLGKGVFYLTRPLMGDLFRRLHFMRTSIFEESQYFIIIQHGSDGQGYSPIAGPP